MGYKEAAFRGISWMGFLQFCMRVLALLKIAIILRILTALDLGIFAMAMVVIGLFETITEVGISTFLIQLQDDITDYIDTAWSLQIMRGILLAVCVALTAIPAAMYFKEASLPLFIFIGSLIPFIKGFENPYIANLQKELLFTKEFLYRISIVIVDLLVTVSLALLTQSGLSLVFGLLVSSASGVLVSWLLVAKRPRFVMHVQRRKEVLSFGKWIALNGVFAYLVNQIDALVIGRMLGASSLGVYQVAQKFSNTPMMEVSDVFGKVTLPVYSKIGGDRKRLMYAYIRTVGFLTMLEFALLLGIVLFAKDIILVLAGSKWTNVSTLLPLLAVYGFFVSIAGSIGSLFLALGKQQVLTKLMFLRLLVIVPLMVWSIATFGISGSVYALLGSLLLIQPLALWYLYRFLIKEK